MFGKVRRLLEVRLGECESRAAAASASIDTLERSKAIIEFELDVKVIAATPTSGAGKQSSQSSRVVKSTRDIADMLQHIQNGTRGAYKAWNRAC